MMKAYGINSNILFQVLIKLISFDQNVYKYDCYEGTNYLHLTITFKLYLKNITYILMNIYKGKGYPKSQSVNSGI